MLRSPVVFVHGLFGSFAEVQTFRQLSPATCSAPDLVGYGAPGGPAVVTAAGQVAALAAHVDDVAPAGRVHLVAHSIGAVSAFGFADAFPERVASLVTVEGNFSLQDAFWSRSIAALGEDEARGVIRARLADPIGFLAGDGVPATPELVARAAAALAYQPWRTVWESARAVVETTGDPAYDEQLRRVFARTRVVLVAGQRSASGWHVPDWARRAAAEDVVVPGVGHMMMLEDPEGLGRVLRDVIR